MPQTTKARVPKAKRHGLQALRADVHHMGARAQRTWQEFDAILERIDGFAHDVSKVSRHTMVDLATRFRRFRQELTHATRPPPAKTAKATRSKHIARA